MFEQKENWRDNQLVSLHDMLLFYAAMYVAVSDWLSLLSDKRNYDPSTPDVQRKKLLANHKQGYEIYRPMFSMRGLELPLKVLREAEERLDVILEDKSMKSFSYNSDCYRDAVKTLVMTTPMALEGILFYHVAPDRVSYYNENQFSREVQERFSGALSDMEEAGKCFALGRWTACAFHLMRVVESGLVEMKDFLAIDRNCPSWDAILKQIEKHIASLSDVSQRPLKDKYQRIVARFYAVKDAWRNPTMHVEYKYNEEEATDVFNAVKGFMNVLTDELPEEKDNVTQ